MKMENTKSFRMFAIIDVPGDSSDATGWLRPIGLLRALLLLLLYGRIRSFRQVDVDFNRGRRWSSGSIRLVCERSAQITNIKYTQHR